MVQSKDSELLAELKRLRNLEKSATPDLLLCLREVERRKLYLSKGFSSLYEFCLIELGYNKDEAYYRISAMTLLKDSPQVENQIREGALSLTVAAKAQIAFRKEDKKRKEQHQALLAPDEKSEILLQLTQCSKRETERTLARHFPHDVPPEATRPINDNRTLVQFTADQGLMNKLEKLKGLMAHKNYKGDWETLFSDLADLALKKLEPQEPKALAPGKEGCQSNRNRTEIKNRVRECKGAKWAQSENLQQKPFVPARKSRPYISIEIKRRLYQRAQGQCEFVDRKSGRRCSSRHALELDHKWPKALGGDDSEGNLRWLCRPHNLHAAQEVLQGT